MRAPGAPAPAVAARAGRERVLVVPRQGLLPEPCWRGLQLGGVERLLEAIRGRGRFLPRAEAEVAPEWQQVIPHLVVMDGDRLLTLRRLRGGSERRLRGQVTLGVGGHINSEDGEGEAAWLAGCRREWAEEVVCLPALEGRAVALIKDDAGEVGRVHLGVLVLVPSGGAPVEVRERDKLEGAMVALPDLGSLYLEMETWSQFIYDALLGGQLSSASDGIRLHLPSAP